MVTGIQQSSLCGCLVCECQYQSAVATANDDDDDNDDKVANDDVTVWLILEISRMLVLAVTNAQVCCPVWYTAFQLVICCSHDLRYLATRSVL